MADGSCPASGCDIKHETLQLCPGEFITLLIVTHSHRKGWGLVLNAIYSLCLLPMQSESRGPQAQQLKPWPLLALCPTNGQKSFLRICSLGPEVSRRGLLFLTNSHHLIPTPESFKWSLPSSGSCPSLAQNLLLLTCDSGTDMYLPPVSLWSSYALHSVSKAACKVFSTCL